MLEAELVSIPLVEPTLELLLLSGLASQTDLVLEEEHSS
jgi:hypothetical protein